MGFPMAGHLKTKGHDVTVFNRSPEKAARWQSLYGGHTAPGIAQAVGGARVVFACVGNDADTREVALSAFAAMAPGGIYVDHTTASARVAKELAETAKARGVGFLDAPVSGGQAGAEKGLLTIMCGGEAEVYARAEPLMNAYARSVRLLGEAGSGQLTKMVNQICIAGLIQALAEGMHFAKAVGLDAQAVVDVIAKGAAQSWQMDNRALSMIEGRFDFGFAVEWMRKDLSICLEAAREAGAQLPVTALVDQFYADVEAMGGRRWDTSSLMARLKAR
ncbi:MAG: NAD(P)-dependent oxidoreductase [Alphaproteobacteria bacterium]|nr:NAD(P)-dependent oxidoreductase [Alphaproteobacteria bacterium]